MLHLCHVAWPRLEKKSLNFSGLSSVWFYGEPKWYVSKLFLFPIWKRVYSKRKEFAPIGSIFFPSGVDPFWEEAWYAGKQTGSHKRCFPCIVDKRWKIYKVCLVSFRYILLKERYESPQVSCYGILTILT